MTDQTLTYEAARDELVEVVRRLESGGASLAESMELWQRGEMQRADAMLNTIYTGIGAGDRRSRGRTALTLSGSGRRPV